MTVATAGGGMQSADYALLQRFNCEIPALEHFPFVALTPADARLRMRFEATQTRFALHRSAVSTVIDLP
jgi:hypothetical protein